MVGAFFISQSFQSDYDRNLTAFFANTQTDHSLSCSIYEFVPNTVKYPWSPFFLYFLYNW